MKFRIAFALVLFVVIGNIDTFAAVADKPVEKIDEPRHFEVGLYVIATSPPHSLPKLFEECAERGVTVLELNSASWRPLLDKGLLDYAAAYNIRLFFQADTFLWKDKDMKTDPAKEGEAGFRKDVEQVRSHPHNEQVAGWWFMDEAESNFRPDTGWNVDKFVQQVNAVNDTIRRVDPGAKVISNHSHTDVPPGDKDISLTKSSERQWYDTNEDYSTSSNAFCLPEARRTLAQELLQTKRLKRPFYWQIMFGCGPRGMGPNDYSYYGYPSWMTAARFDQEYPTDFQVVKDSMLVAQEGGADGVVFFCYEGTPTWLDYALVKPDGSDNRGRWEGVRQAMREIRGREGAPALRLANVQTVDGKPCATLELTRGVSDLRDVQVEVSRDEGLTWQPAPGVKSANAYLLTVTADGEVTPKTVYRARARANDGRNSLWVIWRPSEGFGPMPSKYG